MKSNLTFFLKYFIFWYIVFLIQRNLFILYFYHSTPFSLKEWFLCNTHSIFIDLATISYVLIPILIFVIISFFNNKYKFLKAVKYFTIVIIVISNFILVSDIGLFAEWGIKINHKALSYLIYPQEVIASAKASPILLLLSIFLILSVIEIYIFIKYICTYLNSSKIAWKKKAIFILSLSLIIFMGIRGGFQTFPIDRSWSYFSEKTVLNHGAVNSSWNCLAALTEKDDYENNPYKFVDSKKANEIYSLLMNNKNENIENSLFKIENPNIVIVLLESWGAETVGVLNKEIEATPNFTNLSKEGLLFNKFYATGYRTEQALAAIVAGFPSQPKTTIIRKFGKFDKLPSLANELLINGYHTSYYYGGDLQFANTDAYLKSAGFKKIIGQNDFKYKLFTEWGAFDEDLFNFTAKDLSKNKQPFFSIVMTSTSHAPYDKRVDQVFKGKGQISDYLNVIHYSDECLFRFIEESKKASWFQNTVFIMVADHTCCLPKNRQNYEIERHWIPCLIYGPALKDEFKGKTFDNPTSHVDLPAIILSQLKHPYQKFKWSKNVFNNKFNNWAFYTFDEGFGFIKDSNEIVYDVKLNKLLTHSKNLNITKSDSLLIEGKVLLQKLLDDYISLSSYN